MKTLLLVCIMLLTSMIYAQIPAQKTLVQDETWVAPSGKSAFRLITCNDSIHVLVLQQLKGKMYRVTQSLKEDRHGQYWEVSFYFKNECWNDVVLFIRKLNHTIIQKQLTWKN